MTPILFRPQLVRAILDGVKDTTRRDPIVCPPGPAGYTFDHMETKPGPKGKTEHYAVSAHPDGVEFRAPIRYYKEQVLYVREAWCDPSGTGYPYLYKADFPMHWDAEDSETGAPVDLRAVDYKWRPSIHMPKDAARLFLLVKEVRIERLQDITEEQAVREGVANLFPPSERHAITQNKWVNHCSDCEHFDLATGQKLPTCPFRGGPTKNYGTASSTGCNFPFQLKKDTAPEPARFRFYFQWRQLDNKPGTFWESNPYVVVVEFKAISKERPSPWTERRNQHEKTSSAHILQRR